MRPASRSATSIAKSRSSPCARARQRAPAGAHSGEVEVFFLMMGLWLVVAVALGMRRPKGLGGAALRARLDAVYGEPHELVKVSPAAFPEADIEFYDRAKT